MIDDGLYIDNFAGGGGASTGIEWAIGRSPDVAINHDAEAVALHAANHPDTLHLCQNVWKADPREVVRQASARRCAELGLPFRVLPVKGLWFSPDCKHFSKAKGSKPVEKGIRDLAWVVVHWVKLVKPDQVWLENVEEFKDWGPLILTPPDENGSVKRVPCPLNKGVTFKRWVRELRRLGGRVEWRELRAFRYGTPTIRKRLFVIIRFDGEAIVWPEPTHDKPNADGTVPGGLKPWRVAFALQDDGWYLRQDIIWSKPNPMPESVTDRCTKAHEYLFLLSKSGRYYFDGEAIAERATGQAAGNKEGYHVDGERGGENANLGGSLHKIGARETRNKRSVWAVPSQPFKEAHFATFPPALIEPCILAGSARGGLVLDPFGGAGTTGLVADRLGRNAVLIELNPVYAAIARKRIDGDSPLFSPVAA